MFVSYCWHTWQSVKPTNMVLIYPANAIACFPSLVSSSPSLLSSWLSLFQINEENGTQNIVVELCVEFCRILSIWPMWITQYALLVYARNIHETHTHRPCIQTVVSCVLTFRVQLATGEYNRITDPSTEQPGTHCGRINVNRKWIECEIGKFNWAERQMRTPRVCVRDSHRRIISSCVFVWFGGYISQ